MLKTRVKVGSITNLSDARYCAGMGVDWLGFPGALDPKKVREITEWVSGPEIVAEWSNASEIGDMTSLIQGYNASMVQIGVQHLGKIPVGNVGLIITLTPTEWIQSRQLLQHFRSSIRYVLLTDHDTRPDSDWITKVTAEFPVLLGYGISPETLDDVMNLPIAGLALNGSDESKPGLKDYASLADILEALETA